jgi:hypothetical protein
MKQLEELLKKQVKAAEEAKKAENAKKQKPNK